MTTLRILTVPLLLLLSCVAYGQGVVTLRDTQGQLVNGTLVSHTALQANITDTVKLYTQLTGASATEINVRRYELWTVPGTQNFFCWGVCYLPVNAGVNPTWISQHWLDLNPGTSYNNFSAYHVPNGETGTARFRYVWFSTADSFGPDSSWVDIEFSGTVSVPERAQSLKQFQVWPNPSQGQDVRIAFGLDRLVPGTELVVYNVLGERLRRQQLTGLEGVIVLPITDLGAGVYFANVEQAGRVLGTRRMVVDH